MINSASIVRLVIVEELSLQCQIDDEVSVLPMGIGIWKNHQSDYNRKMSLMQFTRFIYARCFVDLPYLSFFCRFWTSRFEIVIDSYLLSRKAGLLQVGCLSRILPIVKKVS